MPANEFKPYALHYLNLWLSQDRESCEALAGNDEHKKLKQLKKAAVFYRVARNLPKQYDQKKGLERYGPILKILEPLKRKDFLGEPLLRYIEEVRCKISAAYGNHGTLSLTTKFLWLKIRSPILIYNSQARRALLAPQGDLAKYYSLWRDE
jgi:hypothetical protein